MATANDTGDKTMDIHRPTQFFLMAFYSSSVQSSDFQHTVLAKESTSTHRNVQTKHSCHWFIDYFWLVRRLGSRWLNSQDSGRAMGVAITVTINGSASKDKAEGLRTTGTEERVRQQIRNKFIDWDEKGIAVINKMYEEARVAGLEKM